MPKLTNVDPDLRAILSAMPDVSKISIGSLSDIRKQLAGVAPALGVTASGLNVSQVSIPVGDDAPDLSAYLYAPPNLGVDLRPALLDLHGGGYVAGTAQREDSAVRALAVELACVVLVPDYRLAPEDPFPAAHDDARAALAWLRANASELAIDSARIGIRGVSAGGGLALGLALRCRDEGSTAISFLHLLYPMIDDAVVLHPHNGHHVWTAAASRFGWDAYLRGINRETAVSYAVPARAASLAGMPPTFVAIGSIDLFVSDNLEFARRLIDAGVAVELHVYPGAFHAFNLIADARCSKAFHCQSIAALRRAMTDGV